MSAARLRVALFGTPEFALPTLEALDEHHDVRLVVAQPDRRVGRGMKPASPPVARRARELGLALAQPEKLRRDADFQAALADLDLDVAVTAAYGQILPAALLAVPREGFLNVHASLLPRWRGAAPVQHALIAGDPVTGVTIMQTEAGLDTGPIRLVRERTIDPDDDATTLLAALARLGAEAILAALDLLALGRLPSTPQDDAAATLAPRLTREDGRVRWTDDALRARDRHRGVAGWPGSWCLAGEQVLKVHELAVADAAPDDGVEPGTVLESDAAGVVVACGVGSVRLTEVQAAGKPRMPARAWANGARVVKGVRLA
ncbi:MAG: methionyl-tRNA formyltransferase [Trueperaceae bacterium]|nr:methionyl-tRNA formyltransferase [Trueperaceae bacterium]